MATVNVGGKNISLLLPKTDKTIATIQPGQKYGGPITTPAWLGSDSPFTPNTEVYIGNWSGWSTQQKVTVAFDGTNLMIGSHNNMMIRAETPFVTQKDQWVNAVQFMTATNDRLYLGYAPNMEVWDTWEGTLLGTYPITGSSSGSTCVTDDYVLTTNMHTVYFYNRDDMSFSHSQRLGSGGIYGYIHGITFDGTDLWVMYDNSALAKETIGRWPGIDVSGAALENLANTHVINGASAYWDLDFDGTNLIALNGNRVKIYDGLAGYTGI